MTDLAHIRHLIHEGRWSTARAEASGDVMALEYVRAHARRAGVEMPVAATGRHEVRGFRWWMNADGDGETGVFDRQAPEEHGGGDGYGTPPMQGSYLNGSDADPYGDGLGAGECEECGCGDASDNERFWPL